MDDAVWIEDERMTHAVSFLHPDGELPEGWFHCARCDRIYPGSQWTKPCPGRGAREARGEAVNTTPTEGGVQGGNE